MDWLVRPSPDEDALVVDNGADPDSDCEHDAGDGGFVDWFAGLSSGTSPVMIAKSYLLLSVHSKEGSFEQHLPIWPSGDSSEITANSYLHWLRTNSIDLTIPCGSVLFGELCIHMAVPRRHCISAYCGESSDTTARGGV